MNAPSRRSLAREVALQLLYQQELNPGGSADTLQAFLAEHIEEDELRAFALSLVLGVGRNREELDKQLEEKAENWSLERMAATDRNVLRLGLFELQYAETPGPVAIDEAVELAKKFGSAQSAGFVNGILDKFLPNDR